MHSNWPGIAGQLSLSTPGMYVLDVCERIGDAMIDRFTRFADQLNKATLVLCILLFATMAGSTIATVVMRHVFNSGFLWLQDLGMFAFGLLAILSLPCALNVDRHVRVDIFRVRQSGTMQKRTDWFGTAFFLIPVFLLLLVYSLPEFTISLAIGESSPQIGGLPFYFIVKAGIPVCAVLMLVQGVALVLRRRGKIGDQLDVG